MLGTLCFGLERISLLIKKLFDIFFFLRYGISEKILRYLSYY